MALPWKEVIARPEYQALPDEQKSLAQQQYFDRVVAPQLHGEQIEQARQQFFALPLSGQGQPEVSGARAGLRGVNDALTFGFADEISSGLSASLNPLIGSGNDGESWRERYDKNVQGERALNTAAREQHPAVTAGSGLIGGMLPAIMTGGASLLPGAARSAAPVAARSLPQAIGEGAAVGGAYGAAYGLGSGDGDLEKRLESAGEGAGLGMLAGAAIPAATGGAQAARRAVASPERAAERQLERALDRDGISPEEFRHRAAELQKKFPHTAMPVDAGGENVAGLLERVANTPGAGRTRVVPALDDRQQGQAKRLTDELYNITGSGKAAAGRPPKMSDSKDMVVWDGKALEDAAGDLAGGSGDARRSAYRAIQDAMKSRAQAAKPLYEQAYKEPVPWTFELEELMKTPAMQSAYRDAAKRAANQQRSFDGKFIDLAEDGTYTVKDVPSTGDLDIIKRSLDDQIGTLLRSGEKGKAADIQGIKNQLLGIMDEHSPTYAKARAAWSDPSRYMEAIEAGRGVFNNKISPEEFADIFRRMSPADQEGFRTGAISSIVGRMGDKKTSFADVTADLRSPNMRAKVGALLPDDTSRARWHELLDHEVATSQLRRQATGNSATARRLAEADDADDFVANTVGAARDALGGTLTSFLNRAAFGAYKGARDRLKARSDEALADRLTNPKATTKTAAEPEAPKLLASQGGAAATVPGAVGGEQAAKLSAPPMLPQLAAPEEESPGFQTVDDPVDQLRPNGRPFQARGEARMSKAYRDAAGAGLSPKIVPVDGGFAVRAKDGAREVAAAASAAATSPDNDLTAPTEAQKEAGNYKKGHVRIGGLDITIENPKGSERSGRRPDGTEWRHTMTDHYGYFKRSKGADNEQIDAYIGPVPLAPQVYIVDQLNQDDGSFDEHKVMVGYLSERAAVAAYTANFDKGWKVGQVTKMPVKEFKAWLKEGTHGKPASDQRQITLRQNGKPFEGKGEARVSLAYRNAVKASRKPEIVQVEGGWGVRV